VDFISTFMDYTKGFPTSDIYRLWSAISCVSGALERRVWTVLIHEPVYPNLFVLLVGSPGAGKTPAINPVRRLWRTSLKINVAPDSMTKAGFFDALEAGAKRIPIGGGLVEYSALTIAADELGMFMSQYDNDFASALTGVYDGRDGIAEQRRHSLGVGRKRADVINPIATILAGSQPGYMTVLLPEEVWSMGFTARFIMVYSGERQTPKYTFGKKTDHGERDALWKAMTKEIARFTNTFGEYSWEPEAEEAIDTWVQGNCQPEPDHSRLTHYNQKRGLHTAKLSLISAASRGSDRIITLKDFERARVWLLHAEHLMPNIFRAMKGKSDQQVLEEVYMVMWSKYCKDKKPQHESFVLHTISERTTTANVEKIMHLIEKTGMASRDAGTKFYTPRPKHLHGME
jgi:hypothetical protein